MPWTSGVMGGRTVRAATLRVTGSLCVILVAGISTTIIAAHTKAVGCRLLAVFRAILWCKVKSKARSEARSKTRNPIRSQISPPTRRIVLPGCHARARDLDPRPHLRCHPHHLRQHRWHHKTICQSKSYSQDGRPGAITHNTLTGPISGTLASDAQRGPNHLVLTAQS